MNATLSPRHANRPAHVRDFDVNRGLHNLRPTKDTPRRRVWTSPLWQNVVFLVFLVASAGACVGVLLNPELRAERGAPMVLAATGFALLIFGIVAVAMLGGVLHRARLVLDFDTRSLLLYRSFLFPRVAWRLGLDDIHPWPSGPPTHPPWVPMTP